MSLRTVVAGRRSPASDGAAATLALTGVTVAAAVGMGRLFAGSSYLVPVGAAAVVAHAVMWLARRLGAPLGAGVAGAFVAVGLAAAWILLPETTAFGLPGPATWTAARQALSAAWAEFGEVVAPAPATDGFLLAAMAGVAMAGVLADWAAFRMGVLFEAVVPSFAVFVFTASLGADGRRGLLVALYVAALVAFLAVHHAGLQRSAGAWFASRSRGGTGALLHGAVGLGLVAVVAAVAVGPRLPGAGDAALVAWRDDGPGGRGRRTTVSPLVDIRGRLVDQSRTEVFSVASSARAYWRLTSLDTFNGEIWSSDASYRSVGRRLPGGVAVGGAAERVVQEFRIAALSSIWLPAAYQPQRVEGADDVRYNAALGSLVTRQRSSDGLTYRVESVVPRSRPEDLRDRPGGVALPDPEPFLRLPRLPARVARLARSIEARSDGTAYGKALALQGFFQRGFAYDLGVGPGHGSRALEEFLFATRRGYCEQFAGSYAVLARAMGLPTRVAVGFTPGERGADGRYHVRGLNAHAWPEVFIARAGWVAFEPTPGRGAPGAEAYTGLPEAQARPEDPATATTAAPSATPAPDQATATTPTSVPGELGEGAEPAGRRPLRRHPLVVAAALAGLAAVTGAAAVPLAKAARRRRRRAAARAAADRVIVAWIEAAEALAQAGAPRRAAETLTEHARRAGGVAALPETAALCLRTLARDAAAASYGPGPLADEVARRAVADAATVEAALRAAASARQRLGRAVDPRPLFGAGATSRRA